MKKLILLSVFISASCSTTNDTCTCEAKYTTRSNFSNDTYFYVKNTPIDCQTGKPLKLPQKDALFIKCN